MKTSAFVSRVIQAVPSATRLDVIAKINEALSVVYGRPLASMRIVDSNTGKDPVLSTTSGVFNYTLDTVVVGGTEQSPVTENVAYVGRVYSDSDCEEYQVCFDEDPVTWVNDSGYGSNSPTISFCVDPSGADFFIECYKKCPTIVSETNPSVIPLSDRFCVSYLFPFVTAMYEELGHGRSLKLEEFYGIRLLELQGDMTITPRNIVTHQSERYY